MREGNQNDKIDARRLAELLRLDHLTPVYHGEHGLRTLKELVRSYLTVTKDLARVMTRVKAIYRSWAIPCSGKQVYARCHRQEWLGKITEPGVHRRAEVYYQQLDALRKLRQEVRRDLLAESKKHKAWKRLCEIHFDWSDSGSGVAGHPADATSFSQQAAAVELRWLSDRDAQQRRSPKCRRAIATIPEKRLGAGPQPQLQSRSQEPVQGCGGRGFQQAGPLSGVLHDFSGQGYAARNGATDLSQEDCHHCFNCVEERGVLRRQSSETTNSLSVFDRIRSMQGIFSGGGLWVLETPWFESESQLIC
jgi:hypothetical protein